MSWIGLHVKEVNRKGPFVLSHLPFLVRLLDLGELFGKGNWVYPGPDYMVSSTTSP